MNKQLTTYVERVDGKTDEWEKTFPTLQESGALVIADDSRVIGFYAPGQWLKAHTKLVKE